MINDEKLKNLEDLSMIELEKSEKDLIIDSIKQFEEDFKDFFKSETDCLDRFYLSERKSNLRLDEVKESLTNEEAVSNFPESFAGYLKVENKKNR